MVEHGLLEKGNFRGVLLAHPGTQHSFRLARELHRLGRLAEFHTSFAVEEGGWVDRGVRALNARAHRALSGRTLAEIPKAKIRSHPLAEASALVEQKVSPDDSETIMHRRNARFQNAIPDRIIATAGAVIGFDTASWLLAQRRGAVGSAMILDQSIAHPDSKIEVYNYINARYPEWSVDARPRSPIVREAEHMEHELADMVVAASSFTARTLVENGVDPAKIKLNPYGVDVDRFALAEPRSGPLRLIFVGGVSARKGVPVLIDAWRRLRPANSELWVVGETGTNARSKLSGVSGVKVYGAVAHRDVPHLMRQCDVLVFPSFFEGFGLVLLEAMACGLPTIATPATAAPDLYRSGEGGWIVPTGDVEALAEVMDRLLSNPEEARAMGRIARRIAEARTWGAYGDRWRALLDGARMTATKVIA